MIGTRFSRLLLSGILLILVIPRISATTQFFSGDLRSNANVIGCGPSCTLTPADDDATWGQWAARVETFNVAVPSMMDAITFSYGGGTSGTGAVVGAGGYSPYLTLFDSAGNFLASTYFGTYCPSGANPDPNRNASCYDAQLDGGLLAPGDYSIAVSVYFNMSFAENYGPPLVLADGFTGLGNLDGTLDYAFDVNLNPTMAPVPEPASLVLCAAGIGSMLAKRKLR